MYLYHITQSCSFLLLHNSLSSSKKTVTHHLPNQITICLFSEFNTIIMHGSEGGIWREENHRRPCFYFSSSPVSHWVESIVGLASSTLKVVAGCISILSDKIQYMGAATVIIVYVIPDWMIMPHETNTSSHIIEDNRVLLELFNFTPKK
ncbi:uncharacterized protein LOC118483174 isoform X2 [Helianthus annuus]|uniref:uncharacterized protein LOC118483174 isoform X2 n=1 Tax=Helianthus annuus TaxID=4232 RepID=UPI0016531A9A|nr:uncharacterized protein LOC118483174 isoform X2 [Helianthus annuus]